VQTYSLSDARSSTASKRLSPFDRWQAFDINWYQVVVVAVTTFAIAMDLMFPPSRIALGSGLTVYAGHLFAPLSAAAATQTDFGWLGVELLAIVGLAVIGWNLAPSPRADGDQNAA
jgi:hypothetical protein